MVASTDTDELVRLCHRVVVMANGRVTATLTGGQITDRTNRTHPTRKLPGGVMISRLRFDKYSALYLWALFMIVFTITQGSMFLSWTSFKLVLIDPAVFTGCLALAFLVPLATGTFDLSIGANMSMALVISATLSQQRHDARHRGDVRRPVRVRGRRVHQRVLRRPAQGQQLHRHARYESGDHRVRPARRRVSRSTTRSPTATGTSAVRRCSACRCSCTTSRILAIIVWYVFEHTPVGRHMFATGGNPEAARLAGLRTDRLIWGSLIASGMIAGFAGIIYGWKVGNYAQTVGPGYLFPAIAAVFFGASQLKGRPNVWGTFIALLCPRLGHQGTPAHVHVERAMDRAAVPRPVAAGRRVAGQSPGRGQGAQEQGSCHGRASRTGSDRRPTSPAPAETVP